MLEIPSRYELDATSIKQKVEQEHGKNGYWNTKKGIKDGEDAMILLRW